MVVSVYEIVHVNTHEACTVVVQDVTDTNVNKTRPQQHSLSLIHWNTH